MQPPDAMSLADLSTAAITALNGVPFGEDPGESVRSACTAFRKAAAAEALSGGSSGYTSFAARLTARGASALSDVGMISLAAEDADRMLSSSQRRARELRSALVDVVEIASLRLKQEFAVLAGSREDGIDKALWAMAGLVNAASDLNRQAAQDTALTLAAALYPDGRGHTSARSDEAVARMMQAQASGAARQPFLRGSDAMLVFQACTSRSANAAFSTAQEIGGAGEGSLGPAPQIKEVNGHTWRSWRSEDSKISRDPFVGPAIEERGRDGALLQAAFLWKGERLGATQAVALDNFREADPDAYTSAAERFGREAAEQGRRPETMPEHLRKPIEDFLAKSIPFNRIP